MNRDEIVPDELTTTGGPELVSTPAAFALFQPDQQTQLQADIVRPEGPVYFAGEHCSLYHAWIQGALESRIAAARAINEVASRASAAAAPQ